MAAFLGPLVAGIARAGAAVFARQGAKSVAAARAGATSTAARGAAGAVGRVSAGQTVLEGASWRNARMMTKALELAKKGGGTVRQIIGAGGGAATGAGGASTKAGTSGLKGELDTYWKNLTKGSIAQRYKRLTESGQMLPTSTVRKSTTSPFPSHRQMVEHSEQALLRARQKELHRQGRESRIKELKHIRLMRVASLLISGPAGFIALGKSMAFFSERIRMSSEGLGRYSMLIAGEQRLTQLSQMIADIRTARMTERTYGALSKSGRHAIEAWQRPKATMTNVKNTIGTVFNRFSALFGHFFTAVLEASDRISEILNGIKQDQGENELPQQAFRDYWNAMSQGKWDTDLGADRPKKPGGAGVGGIFGRNPLPFGNLNIW